MKIKRYMNIWVAFLVFCTALFPLIGCEKPRPTSNFSYTLGDQLLSVFSCDSKLQFAVLYAPNLVDDGTHEGPNRIKILMGTFDLTVNYSQAKKQNRIYSKYLLVEGQQQRKYSLAEGRLFYINKDKEISQFAMPSLDNVSFEQGKQLIPELESQLKDFELLGNNSLTLDFAEEL